MSAIPFSESSRSAKLFQDPSTYFKACEEGIQAEIESLVADVAEGVDVSKVEKLLALACELKALHKSGAERSFALEKLGSEDSNEQAFALQFLRIQLDEEAIEALVSSFPSSHHQLSLLEALESVRHPLLTGFYAQFLAEGVPVDLAEVAVSGLGVQDGEEALSLLKEAYHLDSSYRVRLAAVCALSARSEQDVDELLREALHDESTQVKSIAAHSIVKRDPANGLRALCEECLASDDQLLIKTTLGLAQASEDLVVQGHVRELSEDSSLDDWTRERCRQLLSHWASQKEAS